MSLLWGVSLIMVVILTAGCVVERPLRSPNFSTSPSNVFNIINFSNNFPIRGSDFPEPSDLFFSPSLTVFTLKTEHIYQTYVYKSKACVRPLLPPTHFLLYLLKPSKPEPNQPTNRIKQKEIICFS